MDVLPHLLEENTVRLYPFQLLPHLRGTVHHLREYDVVQRGSGLVLGLGGEIGLDDA